MDEKTRLILWLLQNGASFNGGSSLYDGGCGCCADKLKVPEDLKPTLLGILKEAYPADFKTKEDEDRL